MDAWSKESGTKQKPETLIWVMYSYMAAYHGLGDTTYLDRLVADADTLLAERDSIRGVTDYTGQSRPVWRAGYAYTAGAINLVNSLGAQILRIRNGQYGTATSAGSLVVSAGTAANTFKIVSTTSNYTNTFDNLSMDPASADYVVTRLYWADPNTTKTTAVDLRPSLGPGPLPVPVSANMVTEFMPYGLHTGLLLAPIADFAATVLGNPALQTAYGAKAEQYVDAIEAALAVHEPDWRQNASGEGWYIFPAESPMAAAGSPYPHNQNLAVALLYIHLANATGNTAYRTRATRLLTTFRNDLTSVSTPAGPVFTWRYNWTEGVGYLGWARTDHVSTRVPYYSPYTPVEDTSHGCYDIRPIVEAYRNGLVFSLADMQTFARTFSTKIVHTDTAGLRQTYKYVDGTGALESGRISGVWAPLTDWDSTIFTFAKDLYNALQPAPARNTVIESIATLVAIAAS